MKCTHFRPFQPLRIESKEAPNNVQRSTKITDLPLELLLLIFECLDLNNLASVSKIHPNTLIAAEMLFRNKYHEKVYNIDKKADFHIFKAFKHLIKKLEFSCQYDDPNSLLDFNRSMNKSNLISVTLWKCNDNSFKYLTHAFKNVENVRLRDCSLKQTDLNEIFPAMKSFDIQSVQKNQMDPVVTVQHFPHLKEFRDEFNTNTDFLKWRLRLNPQLKQFYTHIHEWNDIRIISQMSINLERLDLEFDGNYYGSTFRGDPIQFPNLKAMRIAGHFNDIVPMVFGNLEDFSCRTLVDQLFRVVLQNKKLRKIATYDFTDDQFQRITDELPNLEEIMTGYDVSKDGRVDTVVQFMLRSDKLRKFNFWKTNYQTLNTVADRLSPHWNMTINSTFGHYIFIRNDAITLQ